MVSTNIKTPIGKGRPSADPVDRIKAKIWYLAVKARGGWTDYKLDIEFARRPDEPRRAGPDRIRAFEAIRNIGTVPSPGTHRRRNYDLVENVDAHPDFTGTADIFRSSFWNLLKANEMGIPEAQAFTSECMARCKVFRPSGKLHVVINSTWPHTNIPHITNQHIYQAGVENIISSLPVNMDTLALVGGLFREAYLLCALEVAGVLKSKFLQLLEEYCYQAWLGTAGNELLQLAERRVLFWQMNKHFSGEGYYDDWPPAVIERPLFPLDSAMQELIEKEDELFDQFRIACIAAMGR